jgi:hypothetical protein
VNPLEQQPNRPPGERPRHPKGAAIALIVGVTLLIVLLAVLSTPGRF